MEWFVLILVSVFYVASAYLTYNQDLHKSYWFWPAAILLGNAVTITWFLTVQYLGDKHRIYFYSLCWDATYCLVYYFVPILLFDLKLDRWCIAGIILMAIGLAIVKARI